MKFHYSQLLLLLLFFPSVASAQETTFYPDGTVQTVVHYDAEDMTTYHWKHYHQNRRLAGEGDVVNGSQADGLHRGWHDNGNLHYEFTIEQGVPNGSFRVFHPNGTEKVSGTFTQGKMSGKWSLFNDKGIRTIRGEYNEAGRFLLIDARDAFRHQVIRNGEGEMSYRSHQGYNADDDDPLTVWVNVTYENGVKTGERMELRMDSTLNHVCRFEHGAYTGRWILYDEKGTARSEYNFINGYQAGKQVARDAKGKVISNEEFPGSPPPSALPLDTPWCVDPMKEDLIWAADVWSEVPGTVLDTSQAFRDFLPMLCDDIAHGKITVYRNAELNTEYDPADLVGERMYDTLGFGNELSVNRYDLIAGEINSLILRETWYYDKQTDMLGISTGILGFRFGKGDTALVPVFMYLPDPLLIKYPLIAMIRDRRIPTRPYEKGFSSMYEDELYWIHLSTYWMEILASQLNLEGIDRKNP